VLNDSGNRRVSILFLRETESEELLKGMNKSFADNNSASEMAAIEQQMKQFRDMITSTKKVKKGDLIVLDLTSAGTQVSINGKSLGTLEDARFNQALLKVWLGQKPVDASLKKAMLGL